MRTTTIASIAAAAAFAVGGAVGAFVLLGSQRPAGEVTASVAPRPVWTEVEWPFLIDEWGKGKAYRCKAADCGTEVNLYLRAKLGFCNCTTGVADDEELERLSDFRLVGDRVSPLAAGQPIAVAWMKGRSRAYALGGPHPPGKTALAVAFNDRCDAIVAIAVLAHDRPAAIEPGVIAFLNGGTVMRWAEVTLGL